MHILLFVRHLRVILRHRRLHPTSAATVVSGLALYNESLL